MGRTLVCRASPSTLSLSHSPGVGAGGLLAVGDRVGQGSDWGDFSLSSSLGVTDQEPGEGDLTRASKPAADRTGQSKQGRPWGQVLGEGLREGSLSPPTPLPSCP